jgi:hypothetical protein
MRRVICLLLVIVAGCGIAACGSSSSGSGSPLANELSYFPSGSPFVMSVVTDPSSPAVTNAQALVRRFPIATLGETALFSKLQQLGINYNADVRPLFGNPIAFGLTTATVQRGARNRFLAVWITKDAGALGRLVKKGGLHRSGSHDGATLYESGSATFAVDGATLLIASTPAEMTRALDRHAHGGGLGQADYTRAVSGLPQNALVEAFGDLTGVLSTPRAATARRVPWVSALRGYAAAINASANGLSFQYKLDTTGGQLSSSQLPFAGGSAAPSLAGTMPIQFGLRDPAQVARFVEAAEQAAAPGKYSDFATRQAAVRRKTGVDLNTLIGLLTGDLIVNSDTRTTVARVGVTDPAAAARTVGKLASQPKSLFRTATGVTKLPGGFYELHEGHQTITVGVVGSQLVVGRATPAQLRSFATAAASPASNAQGSLAFRVGLPALLQLTLKHPPSRVARTILNALGDVTGWAAASTSAVTGNATLGFR